MLPNLNQLLLITVHLMARPCGPMDKASDFESEDCGFDPHHGQGFSVKASFRVTKVYSALITLYVRQAVRGS